MSRPALALASLLLLSACAATQPQPGQIQTGQPQYSQTAQRSLSGAETIADAARTLRELRGATRHHILDHAIEDACAVIVLPGVYHAGFYYSVHGGGGVLVVRRGDGTWGAPAFVSLGGAGVGLQIGVERQRIVLVVQEREMLQRILVNGLSFDAIAKYDVLNVREETGPDSLTRGRPVAAFTDGAGLMVGVAFRGALLTLNEGNTRAYHGADSGDARAVLAGSSAPGIEVFDLWGALHADLPQGQIQRVAPRP